MSTAQPALQAQPEVTPVRWSLGTRIAFRFVFSYFVLYAFPFPVYWIPYTGYLLRKYRQLCHFIAPWTGKHILHLGYPITVFTNGSGDTTYDYVVVFCTLTLALAATLAWSLLDRKRLAYGRLCQWFWLYLRFYLAQSMISYGATKVIKLQFPDLRLSDLMITYGQSTPMHLLWNFMEASKSYTFFAGAVELLGGILLIVPRLRLLGSLVSIGAMGNIFMLNMSYDVPVKLFSFHLLVMGALLAAPDLQRLADLFVFNRRVEPTHWPPLLGRKWLNTGLLVVQLAFGCYMVGQNLLAAHRSYETVGSGAPKLPLYGVWSVDEFRTDDSKQPPLSSSVEDPWQQVVFDDHFELVLQLKSGRRERYLHEVDTAKKTVSLSRRGDQPPLKAKLNFDLPGPDSMILSGNFDGLQIHAKLHRIRPPQFILTTRGFHWINEYPFNRFNEH
jgi:hypothetical protein